MKKHPNDEPVPLNTALWLENHERIDAMLKLCPFCGNFNSTGINTECYVQQHRRTK